MLYSYWISFDQGFHKIAELSGNIIKNVLVSSMNIRNRKGLRWDQCGTVEVIFTNRYDITLLYRSSNLIYLRYVKYITASKSCIFLRLQILTIFISFTLCVSTLEVIINKKTNIPPSVLDTSTSRTRHWRSHFHLTLKYI